MTLPRTFPRSPIPSYLLSIACLLLFACTVGASCNKSQRVDTLRASVISVNVARDGFTTWDSHHQAAIIRDAATREAAQTALSEYRDKQSRVVTGFEVAYRALAVAATQTDEPSLHAAIAAASELLELVESIKRLSAGGSQ